MVTNKTKRKFVWHAFDIPYLYRVVKFWGGFGKKLLSRAFTLNTFHTAAKTQLFLSSGLEAIGKLLFGWLLGGQSAFPFSLIVLVWENFR